MSLIFVEPDVAGVLHVADPLRFGGGAVARLDQLDQLFLGAVANLDALAATLHRRRDCDRNPRAGAERRRRARRRGAVRFAHSLVTRRAVRLDQQIFEPPRLVTP